ncbi:TOG array regulator of axonemal microtubules protein 1-like [Chenopodium quinoa]|uniref:TOG domain-containing protein n=1 Tax=Chenopodium quinoa TaxID=63459 RepID=A0A803N701_CHEQI|nr:TOG array regulator of axonemal microtubules protein 1-like [Chenopodium quinoa]
MALPSNCDENAPAVEITIDYLSSEDLKPLSDPDTQIQGLLEGLESKDWIKVCESLNDTRRLAIYHSTLLLPLLEPVVVVLVKAMKNPRSALCKTSIMAAADIFVAYRDKLLEPDFSGGFDNLLLQLLLKASQDKRFVCEEAEKTLKTMVQSITPLPLLHNLQKYARHSNPKVRAKAAVSISNCVSRMSFQDLQDFGLVSLVQVAANLLNDRLPEAREAARSITMSVYKSFTENDDQKPESWQIFCESNLPVLHGQSIIKITTTN